MVLLSCRSRAWGITFPKTRGIIFWMLLFPNVMCCTSYVGSQMHLVNIQWPWDTMYYMPTITMTILILLWVLSGIAFRNSNYPINCSSSCGKLHNNALLIVFVFVLYNHYLRLPLCAPFIKKKVKYIDHLFIQWVCKDHLVRFWSLIVHRKVPCKHAPLLIMKEFINNSIYKYYI